MNMLFAAICLLFKSKAGLGSKPKSLRLFAVCAALSAALSVLLSRLIKVPKGNDLRDESPLN